MERRISRGERPRAREYGDGWERSAVRSVPGAGLARGLGWFSIGLGLAEVIMPRRLTRLIGVRGDHDQLVRLFGMREIASGIGVLSQRRPRAGMWSRVGGDALDLAMLGTAFSTKGAKRERLAGATAAVAGVTVLDIISTRRLSRPAGSNALEVVKAVTIDRSPEELYQFWRDFRNLPRFMKHLESVEVSADGYSHWVAKGPAGMRVEWDARITRDVPNEMIAWSSLEGGDVDHIGSVRFERAPGGRGTVVKVELEYLPPAGAIGATIARLFGEDPEWQVKDDLRRFKQVMETGEVATTEGQPSGRRSLIARVMRRGRLS